MNVGGREAQQPKARIEKKVLSSVVLDQPISVIGAVVLDDEPSRRVVEVGSANKTAIGIAKLGLDFWSPQAGLNQKPAQSRLHRRFGRLRQIVKQTEVQS